MSVKYSHSVLRETYKLWYLVLIVQNLIFLIFTQSEIVIIVEILDNCRAAPDITEQEICGL